MIDLGHEDEPIRVDPVIDPVPHRPDRMAPVDPASQRQGSQTGPARVSDDGTELASPGAAESVV